MIDAEVLDKIQHLPQPVQQHLFLYVDFLYHAYAAGEEKGGEAATLDFFAENELTEAGKHWLEERAATALANPEKRTPWKEAREKIHKKHHLPQ